MSPGSGSGSGSGRGSGPVAGDRNQTRVRTYAQKKNPSAASPSASIILISPTNQVLLLHRKQSSSAFPSAHVFPGGNLDPSDGELPTSPTDVNRHMDSLPYRIGAIRELFEETGILLALPDSDSSSSSSSRSEAKDGKTRLLRVSEAARLEGRKAVHSGKLTLQQWLATLKEERKAKLHTDGLIPFTHWVTPPNVPKRFTTQMYLYLVDLADNNNPSIHQATSDEVETMHPEFKSAREWIQLAQRGDIILFPPQFLLLHLISRFLDSSDSASESKSEADILARRRKLYDFITTDKSPVPWTDKYISPIASLNPLSRRGQGEKDGDDDRILLRLHRPGPELEGSGLVGDDTHVILTKFTPEGTRQLEIRLTADLFPGEKPGSGNTSKL